MAFEFLQRIINIKAVPKKSGLRVYVLGAGCSYNEQRGYPLAKGFLSELESYVVTIQGRIDHQRIEKAAQQTIGLLKHFRHQAFTIDQLIGMILKSECDAELTTEAHAANHRFKHQADLRYEAVLNAKIATAACFLEKEEQAVEHLMPKYQTFIREIFGRDGISAPYTASKFQNSNARVLTFNYDRLFELAFFFIDFSQNHLKRFGHPPEFLNSGLYFQNSKSLRIEKERFCLLKMHGSVGVRCEEDKFDDQLTQGGEYLVNGKKLKVNDDMFFKTDPPFHTPHEPLIVFPWEKHFILDGKNNKAPFRDYISAVWKYAKSIFQEASEIYIIGYSFRDEVDSKYLIDLMREAKDCRQIEVQNISHDECDWISNLLLVELEFKGKIKMNLKPFGNELAELASGLNPAKLAA